MSNKITQKKSFRIAIISVILVLCAAISFVLLPKLYQTESSTMNVVMPRQDIPAKAQITEDMLIMTTVGSYGRDTTAITNTKDIIGKYAKSDISAKDLIYPEKLSAAPVSEETSPLVEIADNQVLVSLPFSSIAASVGGYIGAGDKVNVAIFTGGTNGANYNFSNDTAATSNTVEMPDMLQGLTVYSVQNNALNATTSDGSTATGLSSTENIPAVITLVVTNEQAKLLVQDTYSNTIHFILAEDN